MNDVGDAADRAGVTHRFDEARQRPSEAELHFRARFFFARFTVS